MKAVTSEVDATELSTRGFLHEYWWRKEVAANVNRGAKGFENQIDISMA